MSFVFYTFATMATIQEIVFNIRNTPSGGRSHRARGFSNRQIEFMVRACRAFLVYADVSKYGDPNPQFEQDLGCVSLQTVDQADCKMEWGEDVKKVVIPRVIDCKGPDGKSKNLLTFFGLINKQTRIYLPNEQYGDLDEHVPFKKKNGKRAYMIGQTIYVTGTQGNAKKLCAVNVRGVFYDPTLVQTCGAEGLDARCFDKEKDCYPIPAHLEQSLYDMVFERYIDKGRLPEDITNDEKKQTVA